MKNRSRKVYAKVDTSGMSNFVDISGKRIPGYLLYLYKRTKTPGVMVLKKTKVAIRRMAKHPTCPKCHANPEKDSPKHTRHLWQEATSRRPGRAIKRTVPQWLCLSCGCYRNGKSKYDREVDKIRKQIDSLVDSLLRAAARRIRRR